MPATERKTFALTLVDVGTPVSDGDPHIRLRRLLKHALRILAFRSTDVREVPPREDPPHAEPAESH